MEPGKATHRRGAVVVAIAVAAVAVMIPALAFGHIERASYWPDPAPDTSVKPAAGGSVPAVRSVYTSLKKKEPGKTRVVCETVPSKQLRKHGTPKQLSKNESMKALNKDLKAARKTGYKLRESQPAIKISKKKAKKLRKTNIKLLRQCKYKSIQDAVTASHNNDRVEIMPGPLHRAEVARQADQRPGLRPVQDHQRQEPGRRGLLRLPVALPERPEPDRGPGPSADRHSARSPRGSTATSSPTRSLHPLQPADPGHRRLARRRHDRRRQHRLGRRRRRSGPSRTSASGPTAPTASSSTTSRSAMPRSTTST